MSKSLRHRLCIVVVCPLPVFVMLSRSLLSRSGVCYVVPIFVIPFRFLLGGPVPFLPLTAHNVVLLDIHPVIHYSEDK